MPSSYGSCFLNDGKQSESSQILDCGVSIELLQRIAQGLVDVNKNWFFKRFFTTF
jgi:hypothetical protein